MFLRNCLTCFPLVIKDLTLLYVLSYQLKRLQDVIQLARTMSNEADVTNSNPPPPSCADMLKKKSCQLKQYSHNIFIHIYIYIYIYI
jgi:hypothetical protein